MNIFINPRENRVRAGWRILLQFVLFLLAGLALVVLINQVTETPLEIYNSLALFLAAVASVWIAARYLDRYTMSDYGLKQSAGWFKELGWGIIAGAAAMGFIFFVEWLAGWVTVTGFGWERSNPLPYAAWFSNYLVAMVLVGFYEELIFRGYHIRNLTDGFSFPGYSPVYSIVAAVGISSLIFGLLHAWNQNASITSTFNIVLAGIVIAFPFIITGRLGISIGIHFSWNFMQGGLFGFPVSGMIFRGSLLQIEQSGPDLVTGGSFGPEAGLLGLLGELLVVLLILAYFRYSGETISIDSSFGRPKKPINEES